MKANPPSIIHSMSISPLCRRAILCILLLMLAGLAVAPAHARTVTIGSGDLNASCNNAGNARVWSGTARHDATTYISITSKPSGANAQIHYCIESSSDWFAVGPIGWFGPISHSGVSVSLVLVTDTVGQYSWSMREVPCPQPYDPNTVKAPCKGGTSAYKGSGSGSNGTSSQPYVYRPPTGETLNSQGYQVSAAEGLESGIQFQRRDASAVGLQAVLDAGFIDAVDVWGNADQKSEVCLPYSGGALVFLDVNITPRVVTPLAASVNNGFICATVNGPGLIVLVESWTDSNLRDLQNCTVTATHNLNFRDAPAGQRIGRVTKGSTLTATARTDDWFQVDNNGVTGWISARYVKKDGDCG